MVNMDGLRETTELHFDDSNHKRIQWISWMFDQLYPKIKFSCQLFIGYITGQISVI